MEYLKLGTILDSHGLDGTMKIYSTTSFGDLRYQKGSKVFFFNEKTNERLELKVLSYRHSGTFDFVKFDTINDPETAKQYKGYEVQVIKDSNDLKVGYYFYSDLEGCKVIDQDGNMLGTVKTVEEFPAQITLRVKKLEKGEFFVPFIKQFIISVNIEEKIIKINVIEGML